MVTNQSTPSYFVPITKHSLDYFYVMCQQDIIAKSAHNDIFSYEISYFFSKVISELGR